MNSSNYYLKSQNYKNIRNTLQQPNNQKDPEDHRDDLLIPKKLVPHPDEINIETGINRTVKPSKTDQHRPYHKKVKEEIFSEDSSKYKEDLFWLNGVKETTYMANFKKDSAYLKKGIITFPQLHHTMDFKHDLNYASNENRNKMASFSDQPNIGDRVNNWHTVDEIWGIFSGNQF